MKLRSFSCLLILFFLAQSTAAQEQWDLQRCVTYALQNNISVRQADIQARITALQSKLTEAGRYPNAGISSNAGYNFGRSVNPATNTFENQRIFFSGFSLQSNVNLFNWFSQRYAVEAGRLDKLAADAAIDKAKNDVALNVAIAYLQVLLAHEQTEVSAVQINQSKSQLAIVRKQVDAGALPELNASELEAQVARDSANYITARSTFLSNVIQLKALLNLDMARQFDVAKPDVATIPLESLADLQPQLVYAQALKNLPQQRVNDFRYQAALKNIQSAKASMYPTISAFGSIGSRYSSLFPDQENIRVSPTGKFDTLGLVELSPGVVRSVVRPQFNVVLPNTPFGRQLLDINLSQAVGLNLSIPIFNNRQLRTNWERSKLNAESIRLDADRDNLVLQQDIYSAYNDAVNAVQRYNAAVKAVEAAEKTFNFSQKRYDVGLLPTIELITNQNNLYRARLDALSARYEYVFRMKLLEFYKGAGLRL
ncbi:MAG TPA: TolC family protein [Chitinophagaceae bacterium]|nr:TolC family protein [Chitinophagaceae bacterium]